MLTPETWTFVDEHEHDDVRKLALGSKPPACVDFQAALVQIAGRQLIKEKIPSWYAAGRIVFPSHLPLEQCSSEQTARYKASLVNGKSLVDLTGGIGVDFAFVSSGFDHAVYVEQQEELCKLAENNFPLLGLRNTTVFCGDGVAFLEQMERVDCIYVDPARRNSSGKKTVGIGDCCPDVKKLSALLTEKADTVLIKLSPMLDVSQAWSDLPQTAEIHIISVNNECKELLLMLNSRQIAGGRVVRCVNIKGTSQHVFSFDYDLEPEAPCPFTSIPGKYIYEPNSSLMKAGAFRTLSGEYQIRKFHPNSHLYTSDFLIKAFPGRIFEFKNLYSFGKRELQNLSGEIGQANLTVRNFPATVADLRKRLKLKEGGDTYLFATTLENGSKVLLRCSRLPELI